MLAMEQELLTPGDVAKILKTSEETVKRLLRQKQLSGYKVSGAWRISRADLSDYLARQRNIQDK